MDIQVQTRNVAMQPAWRALIDGRLAKLGARYPELLRLHLTLDHPGHHRRGLEAADVVAHLGGASLPVGKQRGDMLAALHAVLDAVEREIARRHEIRHRSGARRP